jgi:hypothetical protein
LHTEVEMEAPSLAASSILSILGSLSHENSEKVLQSLIAQKSRDAKILLLESLAENLYGGIKFRYVHHFVIFSMRNIGDLFSEDDYFINEFYHHLDADPYKWPQKGQADDQILFMTDGMCEEVEDGYSGVKFDCCRPYSGNPEYPPQTVVYGRDYYEHPDAKTVYHALLKYSPEIFENPVIVMRLPDGEAASSMNTLLTPQHNSRGMYTSKVVASLYRKLLKTRDPGRQDTEPEIVDLEFGIVLNGLRWYVLHRDINC